MRTAIVVSSSGGCTLPGLFEILEEPAPNGRDLLPQEVHARLGALLHDRLL
jgi:hypothetical protein